MVVVVAMVPTSGVVVAVITVVLGLVVVLLGGFNGDECLQSWVWRRLEKERG